MTGRFAWVRTDGNWRYIMCAALTLQLLLAAPGVGFALEPGYCSAVSVGDQGLIVSDLPCSSDTPSGPVYLDTPQLSVSADAATVALSGATTVFGVGLAALQNNPAGMAQVRQYALSLGYGYHERPENHAFTVAATDSLLNPNLAGGIMYTYQRLGTEIAGSQHRGSAQRVRLGATLSEHWQSWSIHLGAVGQLDDETVGSVDRDVWNFDVGALIVGFQMLRIGGVIQRVLDRSEQGYPRRANGGIGFGRGPVQVEYNIGMRMDGDEEREVSHAVGLQAAPYAQLPIRLGYRRQPSSDFQSVSGGLGYVFLQGGFDISYAQELGGENRRWVVAQLRVFLGN